MYNFSDEIVYGSSTQARSCPSVWKNILPLSRLGYEYQSRLKPSARFLWHSHPNGSFNFPGVVAASRKDCSAGFPVSCLLAAPCGNTLSSRWEGSLKQSQGKSKTLATLMSALVGLTCYVFTADPWKTIQRYKYNENKYLQNLQNCFVHFINPHATVTPILQMREMKVL